MTLEQSSPAPLVLKGEAAPPTLIPPGPPGPISLPAQPGEKTRHPPFSWELIVHVHGSQDPLSGETGLSRGTFGAPLYILASPTA